VKVISTHSDPPASNRGVGTHSTPLITSHLDWLSASFPIGDDADSGQVMRQFQRIAGVENAPLGEVPPRRGFQSAMQFEIGRLDVYTGTKRYAGLVFTGKDLAKIANHHHAPRDAEILTRLAEYGGKPSRMDVALNIFEVSPITDLIKAWNDGEIETLAKGATTVRDLATGGDTLYVGSRSSELMLRAYDKAIESGNLGALWTRLELEAKDVKAQSIAKTIIKKGVYGIGYWWRRFDFKVDWFDNAINALGEVSDPEPVKREVENDKRWWLENQILPALEKIKVFDAETWNWFLGQVNEIAAR
jgi:hypothetical protein